MPAAVRAGTDLAESYQGRPAIKTAEAAGAAERPDNYSVRAAALAVPRDQAGLVVREAEARETGEAAAEDWAAKR